MRRAAFCLCNCLPLALGLVGSITVSAQTFTTLHSFSGADGAHPEGGLVQASDGNFYGTTVLGGESGYGTIFSLSAAPSLVFNDLAASPSVLWAPNHKLIPITLDPTITGGVSPITWHIASVISSEPDNGVGDGNTTGDIVVGSNGHSLQLRAERSGMGNGRTYTITVQANDNANQSATRTVSVFVPKSQGK